MTLLSWIAHILVGLAAGAIGGWALSSEQRRSRQRIDALTARLDRSRADLARFRARREAWSRIWPWPDAPAETPGDQRLN